MEEIRDMNLQLFAEGAGGEAGAEGQSKGRGAAYAAKNILNISKLLRK